MCRKRFSLAHHAIDEGADLLKWLVGGVSGETDRLLEFFWDVGTAYPAGSSHKTFASRENPSREMLDEPRISGLA